MANSRVEFKTSMGTFVMEVYEDKAPVTAANFLEYVKSGFYDGTIFHRVIPGFVAQGGGFVPGMDQKRTREPIVNEAKTAPKNTRGTLSMARTMNPDSATSQFFINLVDNGALDHRDDSQRGYGYAVFGKVVEGMDAVDAIRQGDGIKSVKIEGDAQAALDAKADRVAEWNKIMAA